MEELLIEYANNHINERTLTKQGYCKRCLNEKWMNASQKKIFYQYEFNNEDIFICFDHVGCMEVAKEMIKNRKPRNDLEKQRSKRELRALIEEGERLLQ